MGQKEPNLPFKTRVWQMDLRPSRLDGRPRKEESRMTWQCRTTALTFSMPHKQSGAWRPQTAQVASGQVTQRTSTDKSLSRCLSTASLSSVAN